MNRRTVAWAAIAVAAAAALLFVGAATLDDNETDDSADVVACWCPALPPMGELAARSDVAIFIALVGEPLDDDVYQLLNQRWYHGNQWSGAVLMRGTDEPGRCDLNFTPRELRLIVVRYDRDFVNFGERAVLPSTCVPDLRLDTPAGQAMIAEAERWFSHRVEGPPPTPPRP